MNELENIKNKLLNLAIAKEGAVKIIAKLTDEEVKMLFKNQHQNMVYLNKSIDSLQKQVTKLNEINAKSVTVMNSHFNSVQNQVNTLFFHIVILLFLFILLFFIEFLLQAKNNSILLYKFTS